MLAAILPIGLAACATGGAGGAGGAEGGRPDVVVTTTIWGDVVGHVAGVEASVEVLFPIGVDAHGFQPSAQQAARLREADLVVANGLGLEESLVDLLGSTEQESGNVLELASLLEPIPFGGQPAHEGEEEERVGGDPHVWMDPQRVAQAAGLIAKRLEALAPGDWLARAEDYTAEVIAADRRIEQVLADVGAPRRRLVTNHEAFGYFAARYDFEVIGVIVPGGSTLGEPSTAEFAELASVIEREGIPAIFAETTVSTVLAESLAAEVGRKIDVVELFTESLGEPGSGGETYLDMIETNAERIRDALA
ncbi:MAG: metal ABC transporter solute-binding protein, Zn/Mn family [Actinomycetota bacterium]